MEGSNMDIFEIMDKYIELDILDKKLKERIKSNSEWHDKASSEEKVLLQLGHYDEASIYTDSVRISSENIRAAQESYQEVKSALFEIDKLYKDTVAALSIDDLNDVIAKMVEKREQLKSSENEKLWLLEIVNKFMLRWIIGNNMKMRLVSLKKYKINILFMGDLFRI